MWVGVRITIARCESWLQNSLPPPPAAPTEGEATEEGEEPDGVAVLPVSAVGGMGGGEPGGPGGPGTGVSNGPKGVGKSSS